MKDYWCTKYALTEGIFRVYGDIAQEKYIKTDGGLFLRLNRDAFVDIVDAEANAHERAQRRLKAIKKEEQNIRLKIKQWNWAAPKKVKTSK